ncbi:hypothetical protein [Roseibium sp. SCP14]|uniref:hypothetical protein n=1 Tax=Roseibium sp. SCP14 TaxID=3141375 RepID=UPI0033367536
MIVDAVKRYGASFMLALSIVIATPVVSRAADDITSHALLVGVCPPWKKAKTELVTNLWGDACENTVEGMKTAAIDRLDVDHTRVADRRHARNRYGD